MAYQLGEGALAKQWVPPSGHPSPNVDGEEEDSNLHEHA